MAAYRLKALRCAAPNCDVTPEFTVIGPARGPWNKPRCNAHAGDALASITRVEQALEAARLEAQDE